MQGIVATISGRMDKELKSNNRILSHFNSFFEAARRDRKTIMYISPNTSQYNMFPMVSILYNLIYFYKYFIMLP